MTSGFYIDANVGNSRESSEGSRRQSIPTLEAIKLKLQNQLGVYTKEEQPVAFKEINKFLGVIDSGNGEAMK